MTRKEYTAKYCNVKPSSNKKSNMEETKMQKAETKESKNYIFKAEEATISRQSSEISKLKEVSLPHWFNLFKHLPFRFCNEPPGENSSDSSEDSSDSSEDSSDSSEDSSFSSEDSSDESSDLPSNVNSQCSNVWYDCKVLECSQCEDEKFSQ